MTLRNFLRRNIGLTVYKSTDLKSNYTRRGVNQIARDLGLSTEGKKSGVEESIEKATRKRRRNTLIGIGIAAALSGYSLLPYSEPEVNNVQADVASAKYPFDLSNGIDRVAIAQETERLLKKDYLVVEHSLRPERHRTVSGTYLSGKLAVYLVDWDNANEYKEKWIKFLEEKELNNKLTGEELDRLTGEELDRFLTNLQREGLVYKVVFLGEGGEASYHQLKKQLEDRNANRLIRFNKSLYKKLRSDIPNRPIFSLGVKDLDGDNVADIYITVPDGILFVDRAVGKTSGNPKTRYRGWQKLGEWFPTNTEDGYLPRTESDAQRQNFREEAIRMGKNELRTLENQLESDSNEIREKARKYGWRVASDFIDHLTEVVELDAKAIDAQAVARIKRILEEIEQADEDVRKANGLPQRK